MNLRYLIITIVLSACSLVQGQKIVFAPQSNAGTQFAGYYTAQEKGYYQAEELDVQIIHPSQGDNAYSLLKKGKAHIISMNLNQALYNKLKGADIVNVMQTSQVNSLMLVGHLPLPNISSLQNRKMGVLSHINPGLIQLILSKYGINAQTIRYNDGVNVFLSGAVDVCLMVSFNGYIQLSECGHQTPSTHIMRLSDWGYDMPEDGVYVLRSYYEQNKEAIHKFVNASKKGWNYVADHQEEAVEISMKYIKADRVATNLYRQNEMLKEILRLQKSAKTGKRDYLLSPQSFEAALNFISPDTVPLKYNEFVK